MLSVSVSARAGWLVGFRELGKRADRQRTVQQRIGGVHVQVHEAGIGRH